MNRTVNMLILCVFCNALLIMSCASQEMVTKRDLMKRAIAKAKQEAKVICTTKAQCDKAFVLARLYVAQKASMDIRYSDENMILTFNPEYGGMTGMAVQKMSDVDDSVTISLIAICKHMDMMTIPGTYPYFENCAEKLMSAYSGFKPLIELRLH